VDADESSAGANVGLECRLLSIVEDVSRRQQEDDDVVGRKLASEKTDASSVASSWMRLRAPSSRSAWTAVGIESCRNPAVFVKSSTRSSADEDAADADPPPRSAAATASATATARVVGTSDTR
jgi:hypothetical protein